MSGAVAERKKGRKTLESIKTGGASALSIRNIM